MNRLALLLPLLCLLPVHAQDETQAVWVTRFDYTTREEVVAIASNCAALGADRILFQVRGNASVFYPSQLEPWSHRLGGSDPGFDPLATLIEEAQARGLAVEAWINVLPLWRGLDPPTDPQHPYLLHPEWVVVGSDGQAQGRTEHYVCANPAREDVRAHVAAVSAEIAANYDVDAIHLDYIRYVLDLEEGRDFSHDPVSLEAFGSDPASDPAGWKAFKAEQVTETVRAIRAAVRAARPGCRVTAAVFPTIESRAKVMQDVETWVREDLVDALYPMTYADDDEEYARRLRESLPLGRPAGLAERGVPVYPGVAVFKHPDPTQTLKQLDMARAAGARGFALFCYASCFPSADDTELTEADTALRLKRVAAITPTLSQD
jgi:uncharacterized lipoprotein YddW (UPF0748 family)